MLRQQPHPAPGGEVDGGLGVGEDDFPAEVGRGVGGFLRLE